MTLSDEIRRLAQEFQESYDDRVAAVADIKAETAGFMDQTHAANRQMAAELRAHLDEQESARLAQAAEDARERAEYVATLKSDTAAMVSDFHTAHQAMAGEQRQRLADDRARLASKVSEMRAELQADFGEAHRLWDSFSTAIAQRRAGQPAPPRRRRRRPAPPPPPPAEEEEEAPPEE